MPPFKQAYHNTHEMEKQEADPSMHPGPLVLRMERPYLEAAGFLWPKMVWQASTASTRARTNSTTASTS